jgi:hypothetical protein
MITNFESYLILVGSYTSMFTYSNEILFANIGYFRECYNNEVSAYYSLLLLSMHIESIGNEI